MKAKDGLPVAVALCLLVLGNGATAQERSWADALGTQVTQPYSDPKHRGFDFWIGEWNMNWRSRLEGELRHQPKGSWTHQRVFPILGGKAIVELAWDRDAPETASQRGFSIRYFDEARERWVMAQNWPSQSNQGLAFLDQLIGGEHLGRMTVYSVSPRRQPDGSIVNEHRRYNFTDIREGVSFRWDGSNTSDMGATWYTWNIVDAHRLRDLDPFGTAGTPFPGVHNNLLCAKEPHGAFDGLEGVWEGTVIEAGTESPARLSAGTLLDGCAVAAVLEAGGVRTFMTFGYADRYESWVSYRLDDRPGTEHSYHVAQSPGAGAVFVKADAVAIVDELTPYYIAENFTPADSLERTVWTEYSDTRIAFRDEYRATAEGAWQTRRTFSLRRR